LKVVRKDLILEDGALDKIITEKEILRNSDYPYIVKMHQGFQDEQRLYFLMEYMHGGSLRNHFSEQ